jgi:FkbM family methyltransferase
MWRTGIALVGIGALTGISCRQAPQSSPPEAGGVSQQVAFSCPVRGGFRTGATYYSQFYEDYILSYVLKEVASGTYVDVGAHDPDVGSVTKHFYLRGWRGVNIEPNPERLAALEKGRPDDENFGVGIADTKATLPFFRFPRAAGLSTFDRDIAVGHQKAGFAYEVLEIPVTTLTDVLDRSARVNAGFELLNVDVEGFERQVLAGLDFARYPPRLVMLESTAPMTEEPTHQRWEPILLEAGYRFAMDDGLNRYYVREGDHGLLNRFLEADYCVRVDKASKGINLDGFFENRPR